MVDKINPERLDALSDKINEKLPPINDAIENSKSFYEKNQQAVVFAGLAFACYLVEKRMVKKVVRKELNRALTQMGFAVELVSNPNFSGNAGETAGILIAQVQEAGKALFTK